MAQILTFTSTIAEPGKNDIHIIKEKITAFGEAINRPNTRAIYTDYSQPFLVRETSDEIYKAINGNVSSQPTNDFV